MRALALAACLALASVLPAARADTPAVAGVVTRLPTRDRVVALSFDACEAGRPMHLDHAITDFLVARQIPFTVFAGGRFARDNAEGLRALAARDFVEIENHSWSHPRDMTLLADDAVRLEVTRAAAELKSVTGREPRLFRFPGGNADARVVADVRALGYEVVHWRWPEGDPAREVDADRLVAETLWRTQPGDILIFHVNGRGWHTAEALPGIVDGLTARGFRFVRIDAYLGRDPGPSARAR